jgi:phage gpG-like protein
MAGISGVRGDFAKLTRSIQGLQRFQADWRKDLSKVLAATAKAEVLRGFREQVDPYGNKWAPLAPSTLAGRRPGRRTKGFIGPLEGAKILQNSGRLRRSFVAVGEPDGVRISTNVIYAGVHQYGHTFPPRLSAHPVTIHFGKNGKIIGRRGKGAPARSWTGHITTGRRTVPQRQMIPMGRGGLRWNAAFQRDTKAFFAQRFSRGLLP